MPGALQSSGHLSRFLSVPGVWAIVGPVSRCEHLFKNRRIRILYPAENLLSGGATLGILCCGTGIGMSIAANKFDGIRAACASDSFSVRFTRLHNDANVLCLGGRVVGPGLGCELADIFVSTEYEGGRHQRRLDMITKIEKGEKL